MANLQTEIVPLEKFVAETRERVDIARQGPEAVNISTKKYDLLEAEIQQEQKNVDRLFDVLKQAQMEEEAEAAHHADRRGGAAKSRLQEAADLMLVLAPAGGAVLPVLAVAWWEFAARRIHEPDEVVAGLAMRVVGAVPELPDPQRARVGADPQAEEIYAAQPDRVDRRHPHHAAAQRRRREPARRHGHQRRRRRGQDDAGQQPGHEPGPRRPQDAADRLRPAPPGGAPAVRAAAAAGLQRGAAGRGRAARRRAADDDRPEPVPAAGRPVGPRGAAGAGRDRRHQHLREAARGVRLHHRRFAPGAAPRPTRC